MALRRNRPFWDGERIARRVNRAAKLAVNQTMAVCVRSAKENHQGWENRTGTAERSIQIAAPAQQFGNYVIGIWGSIKVRYFKFLEFGTGRIRAYATLRSAASLWYPSLSTRIRWNFRRGA